jgi:outer membrane assembly lipoprotein YfgL
MIIMNLIKRFLQLCLATTVLALVACSSDPALPKPADLGPNLPLVSVRTAWTNKVGTVDFPLAISVAGSVVTLASSDGTVASLDAETGANIWRTLVGSRIAAGVGSDGQYAAVVTNENQLVTLEGGRELWRARLSSQVFTSPLVAGKRVFVLGADRGVSAFDAKSGKRLWSVQRPGEALVLRQSGVLVAVNNTLVVGWAGRLVGLDPLSGNVVWDAALATPRGTNDIERLVDILAGVGRNANVVCVRAFQAAVGCVNAERGNVLWKLPASGTVGLGGDDTQVYGVEAEGQVRAWRLANGQLAWSSDRLRYHHLSAPFVLGRSVIIGDETGRLHLLSRLDGSPLTRLDTDGSAVVATPVMAGNTLIAVTRNGGVFAFQPQ